MTYSWEIPQFETREFFKKKNKYCVCVFVLNELGRLQTQLAKMKEVSNLVDIIIADGGSTDGCVDTANVESYGVRAVLIKKGAGKLGAQMRMAFAYALKEGYAGIITVDGNDKDDVVSGIDLFINRLEDGFDHVQGSRFIRGGHHENTPLSRYLAVRFAHAPVISIAARFHYTDTTNGFRAYSRKFLESDRVAVFRNELSGYELHYYLAIEAARQGFRVCEVPVTRVYPATGKIPTKISPLKGNLKVLRVLFQTAMGKYRPH
jgi:dolichol-phosphate mannosyltransferase